MSRHSDRHENCTHSELEGVVIDLATEAMMGATMAIMPLVASGEIAPPEAGIASATSIWGTGLETGIRAALIDPIGAQLLLDLVDARAAMTKDELEEANQTLAVDARHLLEAVARGS